MIQFGISSRFFRDEPLTVDVLERLRKANFQRIEVYGNRPHFDFHNRALVRSVARWFEENRMPPPSLHLPFEEPYSRKKMIDIPLLAPEERLRLRAIDELKRCLEFAERTRVEYAVLHLGSPGQTFNPVFFDYAYAAIVAIQSFSGVRVLIENIRNEPSRPDRIHEFKSVTNLETVGICYDTGHGYLQDVPASFGETDAIQLNDNDGRLDQHQWPFEGRINWPAFVEQMTLAKFKGPLIYETQGGDLDKGAEVSVRFRELCDQAASSMEEYRLKYQLPSPQVSE